MTIYGISQSSGVERRLHVERGATGVVFIFCDHVGNKERERVLVPIDALLPAVTEPPAGGAAVEGLVPPYGPPLQLHVEVRGNEVLLKVSGGPRPETDAAVGLDDLQDALEGVINQG